MLRCLNEQGNGPRCPFVMMTAESAPALVAEAKSLGARGWMIKPVTPEALVATVRELAGAPVA
jgi:two-component system chemotaxis response regulator CheY